MHCKKEVLIGTTTTTSYPQQVGKQMCMVATVVINEYLIMSFCFLQSLALKMAQSQVSLTVSGRRGTWVCGTNVFSFIINSRYAMFKCWDQVL